MKEADVAEEAVVRLDTAGDELAMVAQVIGDAMRDTSPSKAIPGFSRREVALYAAAGLAFKAGRDVKQEAAKLLATLRRKEGADGSG